MEFYSECHMTRAVAGHPEDSSYLMMIEEEVSARSAMKEAWTQIEGEKTEIFQWIDRAS